MSAGTARHWSSRSGDRTSNFSVGYTIVIFIASLLTGFAKQAKTLMQHSESIIRFGSIALILTGLYYIIEGTRWFF